MAGGSDDYNNSVAETKQTVPVVLEISASASSTAILDSASGSAFLLSSSLCKSRTAPTALRDSHSSNACSPNDQTTRVFARKHECPLITHDTKRTTPNAPYMPDWSKQ